MPVKAMRSWAAVIARLRLKHWRTIIEILTLIAVVAYTMVACAQLEQMRLATQAAKRSADAATAAANVARRTLDEGKKTSSTTLAQIEEQTASMKVAAEAERESAAVAGTALRITQRAYVGVVNGSGSNFRRNSAGNVRLIMRNTGRTPAIDCLTLGYANIYGRGQKVGAPRMTMPKGHGIVVQSGGEFKVDSRGMYATPLTYSQVQRVKNGDLRYYFIVSIWYKDVFSSKVHNTVSCRELAPDLTTTNQCPGISDSEN